jgi:K+ potassium transporter
MQCAAGRATGGTFALYAQLRRQGTKAARSGAKNEVQRLTAPDWRQRFIQSRKSQNVLRVLVVLGVGAIMGDGVLTPVRMQSYMAAACYGTDCVASQ